MLTPLNSYVAVTYHSALAKLGMVHLGYFKDTEAFGNEIDQYQNDKMIIVFVRDRGSDRVEIAPIKNENERFDLEYLLAMVEPQRRVENAREATNILPDVASKFYAMFEGPQYACYRRAYVSFENCRNLWGIVPKQG